MGERFKILTDETANMKLAKSMEGRYLNVGLSLAPHLLSGFNVCQFSTVTCRKYCVAFAGNGGVFPEVLKSRVRKTVAFFEDREAFMELVRWDLLKAVRIAASEDRTVACRMNVFSDLPWERMFPWLFDEFGMVQFYDYTKSYARASIFAAGDLPPNYYLTYSRSESNERKAIELLLRGVNAAVVLPQSRFMRLPSKWHGFAVVDGDQSDLRFLDPKGVVVGLRAKGKMRNSTSGMVDRSNLRSSVLDLLS